MIRIVVAADINNAIGKSGTLPWRLKDDMRLFREITMGGVVVMGRKTYESIGKALPGRSNIVLTRDRRFKAKDAEIAYSITDLMLHHIGRRGEIINIIGGGEIYRALWDLADEIRITRVDTVISDADAFIPDIDENKFVLTCVEHHEADSDNEFNCEYQLWKRKINEKPVK